MKGFTIIEFLIVVAIISIVVAVAAAAVYGANSQAVTLRVSEWRCTQDRTEIVLVPMPVGKIIVQQPLPQTACIRWERMR